MYNTWRNPDGDMEGEIVEVPDGKFQCVTCEEIKGDSEMVEGWDDKSRWFYVCEECKENSNE
jgi:hypothetical protein